MAIKYTRDEDEGGVRRISERLGRPAPVRRGGLTVLQPGGGGIFISLGAVILALMLFQHAVDNLMDAPPRIETGAGEVVGKLEADAESLGQQPMLQLRIETAGGAQREVWVPTDPVSWELVAIGERLEVDYALDKDALRVQRLRSLPAQDDSPGDAAAL